MSLTSEQQRAHLRRELHPFYKACDTARRDQTRIDRSVLDQLKTFLNWLQIQFNTSTYLQTRFEVHDHLKNIAKMTAEVPEDIRQQAEALQAQTSPPRDVIITTPQQVPVPQPAAPQSVAPQPAAAPAPRGQYADIPGHGRVRLPPANHRIFGTGGIAHGILLKQGAVRRTPIADPAVKRQFKKYGHNGIAVNSWYYSQLSSLVAGCHGASNGGISGDAEHGAFSVVIAGAYDDRDLDTYTSVWYSAPRLTNDESQGYKILQASRRSQQPVRVLRAASGKGDYYPSVGLRYDGLYKVVGVKKDTDSEGEEHELFKLVREPGQPARDDNVPSAQQRTDFELVKQGY